MFDTIPKPIAGTTEDAITHAISAARDTAAEAPLHDRAEAVAALLRGADALTAAAAGLLARGGIEAVAGRPVEHILRHDARRTGSDAAHLTQTVQTLNAMPALAQAFDEGLVSCSQLRCVVASLRTVRAADRPQIDALIGEHAKRMHDGDPDDLIELVEDAAARTRPDLMLKREDRMIEGNFLAVQGRFDGSASLYGEFDPVAAATIVDALDAVADDPVHPDHGITRGQQRADALVHLAETTLAGSPGGLRPRPRVLATVDLSAGSTKLLWPLPGRAPRLSRVTRDQLLCDATITPIVFDGPRVIGAGDRFNVFSDKVRAAVAARDQRCRFCNRAPASWCDVHHLRPGKGNTVDDGCLLCRRCHRTVHRYNWTITWQPDGSLKFERRGKHFISLPP